VKPLSRKFKKGDKVRVREEVNNNLFKDCVFTVVSVNNYGGLTLIGDEKAVRTRNLRYDAKYSSGDYFYGDINHMEYTISDLFKEDV